MFSIITIASSTTNPVEIVSAISERLSRLKPTRYMATKVPTSDNDADKRHRQRQFELDIGHGSANGRRAVAQHVDVNRGGEVRHDRRQQTFDRVDDLDHVRPRLAADAE